jgi:hypothetical protein
VTTWNSTFDATEITSSTDASTTPATTHATRQETRKRLQVGHDVSTVVAGYADGGRHNPGSGRAYYGNAAPTALVKPNASTAANPAFSNLSSGEMPNGEDPTLGSSDRGLLWLDESGPAAILRSRDTTGAVGRWAGVYAPVNMAVDSCMQSWLQGTSITPLVGVRTYVSDAFFSTSTDGTPAYSRVAGFTGARSTYCMQVAGAASVSQIVFGQRYEASTLKSAILGGKVTWSAHIENTTTLAWQPTIIVRQATAGVDNYGTTSDLVAATVVNVEGGTTLANGSAGYFTHTFDISAHNGNGFEVVLQLGARVAGQTLKITGWQLEYGSGRSMYYEPTLEEVRRKVNRYFYQSAESVAGGDFAASFIASLTDSAFGSVTYPVMMRATPTVTAYNSGVPNQTLQNNVGTNAISGYLGGVGGLYRLTAASFTVGSSQNCHIRADARL